LTQLIDPLTASTAAAALRNAPGVRIDRGVTSSSTIWTIRRPDARARSNIFGLFASTGAAPGSVMPSASQTMCIELAVPIPAQTPGPAIALSHMPASVSLDSLPNIAWTEPMNTSSISTCLP
jgi:hypothetical protein